MKILKLKKNKTYNKKKFVPNIEQGYKLLYFTFNFEQPELS